MDGILLITAMAFILGFSLIFLLALSDKKRKAKKNDSPPQIKREPFEKICSQIVEAMKLEIEEISRSGENQIDIVARNPTPITGGQFLIHCLYADRNAVIGAAEIIEFSNMIVQERLSKGIFMTTGRFTEDISAIGELAPMEFIDGAALQKLVAKYIPDYKVYWDMRS